MKENEDAKVTSISKTQSFEDIADYWDQTHEVEFELRIKRRWRVTLILKGYGVSNE